MNGNDVDIKSYQVQKIQMLTAGPKRDRERERDGRTRWIYRETIIKYVCLGLFGQCCTYNIGMHTPEHNNNNHNICSIIRMDGWMDGTRWMRAKWKLLEWFGATEKQILSDFNIMFIRIYMIKCIYAVWLCAVRTRCWLCQCDTCASFIYPLVFLFFFSCLH